MSSTPPHDLFLSGGGEMGERTRAFDWSKTPVGPVEQWPHSLKTAVQILMHSRYPMFVWWGWELTNFYNDAYIPVLGKRHPRALGKSAPDIWSEIWSTVGPMADIVLTEGRATWNEELLLLMERNQFLEETYFTFSYSPAPDDHGGVGGLFCACTEDTARVLSVRRLRILRELSARTADEAKSVDDACQTAAACLAANPHDLPFVLLYLLDRDGRRARLAGASGELLGHAVASPHLVDLESDRAGWPFRQVMMTGGRIEVSDLGEKFGPLPGGAWPESPQGAVVLPMSRPGQTQLSGFVVAGISPRLDFDDDYKGFMDLLAGHIATVVGNARAYEEEKRRAESLAELDRAKTRFFSNVSHEFRTPLTLMLGPIEDSLAASEGVDALSPAQRERLEVAHRNALRLLKLVNTLLDFSRIEAGRVQASYQPTDLSAFTTDLASNFRSACDKAGLELRVDCAPLPEPVYVDRDMWEKVVLNLISNAFKFTLEGSIDVRIEPVDGRVALTVRDTGVGIPPEEMPKLFERFHRVERARGRTQEGSGIGLALVQELVRLHGGDVRAESDLVRGTTFTVTLPFGTAHLPAERIEAERSLVPTTVGAAAFVQEALRWIPDADPKGDVFPGIDARRPSSPGARSEGPERPRILLADDNADMRDYVRRLLSEEFEVTAVADGTAALEAAREASPELIVADIMMPGLDGFGLLRELRADTRTRELPVILLSARAGQEARVEGLEAGADDYLTKPFGARELLASVHGNLALASLRRESAEALRESEARFRNMADNAPVMIWLTDLNASCTYLNQRWYEFTGTSPAQGLGAGWLDSVHPDDRARSEKTFVDANETRESFRLEYRLKRHDGEYRWVIDSATPRFGAGGEFLGCIGSVIDITELKRVESELREADRRKDEFLATLAHELRNPLAPIRTGLHVLKVVKDDPSAMEHSIVIMERQTLQLTRLIDDLLDISRITRGKLQVRKSRITLADVVRTAMETARPFIDEAFHELTVELPDEPVFLRGDLTRLAQVFSNLLSNAAKYTPKRGRISLTAERGGDQVTVRVKDNGLGIPHDMLDRVFEQFMQVERHSEIGYAGLGIGLTLVKSLVEMHDGAVSVYSEGPNRGSEFTVRLPCLVELASSTPHQGLEEADRGELFAMHEACEPGDVSAEALLKSERRRRVLVVDDNQDAAKLLSVAVEMLGHEVRSARDGVEAIERSREFRPDVVLMDLGMPRMNGYEAARRIRAEPWGQRITLVALTGWGQEADRKKSRQAGFDRHLVKPAEPAALREILDAAPASDSETSTPVGGSAASATTGACDEETLRQIVHDVRGCLNTMVLLLRVIEMKTGGEGEIAELTGKALQSGEELGALLRQLSGGD